MIISFTVITHHIVHFMGCNSLWCTALGFSETPLVILSVDEHIQAKLSFKRNDWFSCKVWDTLYQFGNSDCVLHPVLIVIGYSCWTKYSLYGKNTKAAVRFCSTLSRTCSLASSVLPFFFKMNYSVSECVLILGNSHLNNPDEMLSRFE